MSLDTKCSVEIIHQSDVHLLIWVLIWHPGMFTHIPVNQVVSSYFCSGENTSSLAELETVPLLTPPFCPPRWLPAQLVLFRIAVPTTPAQTVSWSIPIIRNSTSCAGRRAAACGRAGRHNECCSGLQYQPRQRRPYKWSISILPRSQFYKKQGKLAFSTSCTAVRPHRRLRNDAWWRDS